MRRRAERVFLARLCGYGAIAISLIVTGAAGLVDGDSVGVAGLVAGGIAGAIAGLFGYVLFKLRREPFPVRPLMTPSRGRFHRVRLLILAISAGILGIFGLAAIVVGLIELVRGRQFAGLTDAGIFLLAVGMMAGTTAWARWPRPETDTP